jgi:GAF domain-containing protein
MKTRHTVFVEDIQVDKDFSSHLQFAKDAGYRTVISSPLISSRGNMIGVISIHFNLPHRFTKKEVIGFEKFCCDAADTIEEFIVNES